MLKLIINADDFGLHSGINKAVIECMENKSINSASLMVNTPGYTEALGYAKKTSNNIGVHLNIVRGMPICPDTADSALCSPEGRFRGIAGALYVMISPSVLLPVIEKEFRAQIERALAAGIKPAHLDSEKHVHAIPCVFKLVARLAREYSITRVRCFTPAPVLRLKMSNLRYNFLALLSKGAGAVLASHGLFGSDYFYNYNLANRVIADMAGAEAGILELACHPGYPMQDGRERECLGKFRLADVYRQKEIAGLLELKAMLAGLQGHDD